MDDADVWRRTLCGMGRQFEAEAGRRRKGKAEGEGARCARVENLSPVHEYAPPAPPRPLFYWTSELTRGSTLRETARRKQGGGQGANDAANGKAKSAGAQIRRHNEAMLNEVRLLAFRLTFRCSRACAVGVDAGRY